jgi:D-cysteine desulfhydrase
MTPTPLEMFSLTPAPRSGIEIFIKRDDQTGSELSGNKIRKMEFVLYDLISKRSDIIITCGGVQSNHCRVVAALAARVGLDCELILKGKQTTLPDGNFLLDKLYKAKTRIITEKEYEKDIEGILIKRAKTLKKSGRKPYIIPEGASTPLGVWGYFLAGLELKEQLDKAGIKAGYIACAVGSGGTYAGLYLASLYLKWPVKILGFAVCRNTDYFIGKILNLVEQFIDDYKLNLKPDPSEVFIDDNYIGPGYAKISQRETDFIKSVAANSGIILDPAYTSKSMIGLFDYIAEGKIGRNSAVVFIHSGGLLSIFPQRKKLFGK